LSLGKKSVCFLLTWQIPNIHRFLTYTPQVSCLTAIFPSEAQTKKQFRQEQERLLWPLFLLAFAWKNRRFEFKSFCALRLCVENTSSLNFHLAMNPEFLHALAHNGGKKIKRPPAWAGRRT
jgi:hypothetical protein